MNYKLPHIIENCVGERISFQTLEQTPNGDRLTAEAFCQPGNGPIMHTHWQQDEGMKVLSGKMGYQLKGEEPGFALPGESIVFKKGTPHRFWAEGAEPLHCTAWVEPANTFLFFISSVFAAQNKSGKAEPEHFDAAYLLTRYKAEYEMTALPWFVKKIILPTTYFIGRLLGKYRHFKDAPEPLKKLS